MLICASLSSSLTSFWIRPVTPGKGRTSFSCIVRPTKNVSQVLARNREKPEDGLITTTWDSACTRSSLEAQGPLCRLLPGWAPRPSEHSTRNVPAQSFQSKEFFLPFKSKHKNQGKSVAAVRGCLRWPSMKLEGTEAGACVSVPLLSSWENTLLTGLRLDPGAWWFGVVDLAPSLCLPRSLCLSCLVLECSPSVW